MHKGRLEAFSDAIIAIIMTVMVLELRPPRESGHGLQTLSMLLPIMPTLCAYLLSFVFLAIYWNNHHHMLQGTKNVNGAVLWANTHLLFWLSLTPFVTMWLGENQLSSGPVAAYGIVLLGAAISYYILALALVKANGRDSDIAVALGRDIKGKVSPLIYAIGIGLAFVVPVVSCALYVLVALIWLVPDRRFEQRVNVEAK